MAATSSAAPSTAHPTARRCAIVVAGSIGIPATRRRQVDGKFDRGRKRGVPDDGEARRPPSAPPCSTSRSTQRCSATAAISRVDATLEPARRLARQLVPARSERDRPRVPVRCLEHDVGGHRADLGRRAAHHSGERDRAGVVGDDQVVGVERALLAVERDVSCSPGSARRTPIGPRSLARSNACSG